MSAAKNYTILVIGGGNSAGYLADELVKGGVQQSGYTVGIVSNEPVAPYERPALSKAYIHPPQAKVRARLPGFHTCVGSGGERHELPWYAAHGIDLLLNTKCEGVDLKNKNVTVSDMTNGNKFTITYTRLVVATGSRAITPVEAGLRGGHLKNIFTIRTEQEAAKIVKAMEDLTSRKDEYKKSVSNARISNISSKSGSVAGGSRVSNNTNRPLPPDPRKGSTNSSVQLFGNASKNSDLKFIGSPLSSPGSKAISAMRKDSGNRFGHQQSSKLRDRLKEMLDVKATKRNAIYTKLHQFYMKHDPKKLTDFETMSGLITYIETFGHDDLNQTLGQKYGEGIERPEPAVAKFQIVKDGMAERNEIYAKLFLFYNKHDPSRIPELEIAVEVIMNFGIDEFNRRCKAKYGEDLDSQLVEDIQQIQLQDADPSKRETKIIILEEKPLTGALHSLDAEMEQLLIKLVDFYREFDPNSIIELAKIVRFIIENKVETFDILASEKYNHTLTTFLDEEYRNDISRLEGMPERLRSIVIYRALVKFYMRFDQSKLGKLLDIVSYIMYKGIQEFNNKLRQKYGVILSESPTDAIKERDYIFNRLTRFYQKNDQSKLKEMEDLITYIMLNGIDNFNQLLIEKYGSGLADEDTGIVSDGDAELEKIAISNCLTDYYSKKDPKKLQNLENLVAYAMTNGIEKLNKQVTEKYGEPLDYEKYLNNEVSGISANITSGHAPYSVFKHGKLMNPHVVIIGGGYIGIETCSAFAGWGFDITLVISQKLAMSKLFTPKMASWFERYFEENHSINIIKETRVVEFKNDGRGSVGQVVLSNGETLSCDIVICGIGGKPNIEMFEGQVETLDLNIANKQGEELGGIVCDEYLKSSDPNVYAMGDIAAFPHGNSFSRLEHVDNCRKSAACVAHNVMCSLGGADLDMFLASKKGKMIPKKYVYFPYFYSRMFEYTDSPVIFRFYGEKGNPNEVNIIQFGDFNSNRASMFGAFWVNKKGIVIGGLLCNATEEFYSKLYDIILSAPKLEASTEEAALGLFNQEMIVDLI